MLSRLCCVFGVEVEGRVNERAAKGETCADQMTDSFQVHEDVMQFLSLEPSAWCAFRACEQTVLHSCVQ